MTHGNVSMGDLGAILTSVEIDGLRSGYDAALLIRLKVQATAAPHPPLTAWVSAIGETFFGQDTALAPRNRELCLLTLLAYRAPGVSLSTHVYAGLMEGLEVKEICQAIALAGCYGGLPAFTESIGTVRRTLLILKQCAERETRSTQDVLDALLGAMK